MAVRCSRCAQRVNNNTAKVPDGYNKVQVTRPVYGPLGRHRGNVTEYKLVPANPKPEPTTDGSTLPPPATDNGNASQVPSANIPVPVIPEITPPETTQATDTPRKMLVGRLKQGQSIKQVNVTISLVQERMLDRLNRSRAEKGCPAAAPDPGLMVSAQKHAEYMASTGIFRHGNSGFAENIAMRQGSPLAVNNAWMESSGHYRNMMNPGNVLVGLGAAQNRSGTWFWCQQFKKADGQIEVVITTQEGMLGHTSESCPDTSANVPSYNAGGRGGLFRRWR